MRVSFGGPQAPYRGLLCHGGPWKLKVEREDLPSCLHLPMTCLTVETPPMPENLATQMRHFVNWMLSAFPATCHCGKHNERQETLQTCGNDTLKVNSVTFLKNTRRSSAHSSICVPPLDISSTFTFNTARQLTSSWTAGLQLVTTKK